MEEMIDLEDQLVFLHDEDGQKATMKSERELGEVGWLKFISFSTTWMSQREHRPRISASGANHHIILQFLSLMNKPLSQQIEKKNEKTWKC